jgi:hypothetical protein
MTATQNNAFHKMAHLKQHPNRECYFLKTLSLLNHTNLQTDRILIGTSGTAELSRTALVSCWQDSNKHPEGIFWREYNLGESVVIQIPGSNTHRGAPFLWDSLMNTQTSTECNVSGQQLHVSRHTMCLSSNYVSLDTRCVSAATTLLPPYDVSQQQLRVSRHAMCLSSNYVASDTRCVSAATTCLSTHDVSQQQLRVSRHAMCEQQLRVSRHTIKTNEYTPSMFLEHSFQR